MQMMTLMGTVMVGAAPLLYRLVTVVTLIPTPTLTLTQRAMETETARVRATTTTTMAEVALLS